MSRVLVYSFGDGKADGSSALRDKLGGKGAELAEMSRLGIRIPPGFTIASDAAGIARMWDQVREHLMLLEWRTGRRLGDTTTPLFVSVRSGARVSMPGMMDTILNLGLNGDTITALASMSTPEFAEECRLRFVNSMGGEAPHEAWEQLRVAIRAVFDSWGSERAKEYRKLHNIPDHWGTAVTVQAMVFGNLDNKSGTGVVFTRNPSTGTRGLYGEWMHKAQGEELVGGMRTPEPLNALDVLMPGTYAELASVCHRLERHYRDMVDVEFTVQSDTLYILQVRPGKRTGAASMRIAVDLVEDGVIDINTALRSLDLTLIAKGGTGGLVAEAVKKAVAEGRHIGTGLPASPGVVTGTVALSSATTKILATTGKVILVRQETSPQDIGGMAAAAGILTMTGGFTSHAAIIARGMGKPCVVGAAGVWTGAAPVLGGHVIVDGETLTIDGGTGRIFVGTVASTEPGFGDHAVVTRLLEWARDRSSVSVVAQAAPNHNIVNEKPGLEDDLVGMVIEKAKKANPTTKIGVWVCDIDRIGWYMEKGADYVLCNPYLMPMAQLAMAKEVKP